VWTSELSLTFFVIKQVCSSEDFAAVQCNFVGLEVVLSKRLLVCNAIAVTEPAGFEACFEADAAAAEQGFER
jgi:hypothetical protein